MGTLKSLPKLFLLTFAVVSRVSFVLAPSRALLPRLVAKGSCANEEDDIRKMQTTSRVRYRWRALEVAAAVGVLNFEPRPKRDAAPRSILSSACDKKWHIAFVASHYPLFSALETPEKGLAGKRLFCK